jgi:hypothetical protein
MTADLIHLWRVEDIDGPSQQPSSKSNLYRQRRVRKVAKLWTHCSRQRDPRGRANLETDDLVRPSHEVSDPLFGS